MAEQQFTLDMIMEKYRRNILDNTADDSNTFLRAIKSIEKNEGLLGAVLHEKGIAFNAMHQAVSMDDLNDLKNMQDAHQISLENDVLRDLARFSYQKNGRVLLSSKMEEKETQSDNSDLVVTPIHSPDTPIIFEEKDHIHVNAVQAHESEEQHP